MATITLIDSDNISVNGGTQAPIAINIVTLPLASEVRIQGALVEAYGKTDLANFEVNDKFRMWSGTRKVEGVIISLPVTLPDDLDNVTKVKLAVNNSI